MPGIFGADPGFPTVTFGGDGIWVFREIGCGLFLELTLYQKTGCLNEKKYSRK